MNLKNTLKMTTAHYTSKNSEFLFKFDLILPEGVILINNQPITPLKKVSLKIKPIKKTSEKDNEVQASVESGIPFQVKEDSGNPSNRGPKNETIEEEEESNDRNNQPTGDENVHADTYVTLDQESSSFTKVTDISEREFSVSSNSADETNTKVAPDYAKHSDVGFQVGNKSGNESRIERTGDGLSAKELSVDMLGLLIDRKNELLLNEDDTILLPRDNDEEKDAIEVMNQESIQVLQPTESTKTIGKSINRLSSIKSRQSKNL